MFVTQPPSRDGSEIICHQQEQAWRRNALGNADHGAGDLHQSAVTRKCKPCPLSANERPMPRNDSHEMTRRSRSNLTTCEVHAVESLGLHDFTNIGCDCIGRWPASSIRTTIAFGA